MEELSSLAVKVTESADMRQSSTIEPDDFGKFHHYNLEIYIFVVK